MIEAVRSRRRLNHSQCSRRFSRPKFLDRRSNAFSAISRGSRRPAADLPRDDSPDPLMRDHGAAILGVIPPLPLGAEKAHAIFELGGADHTRIADFDQHRPVGVLDVAGSDEDRPQLSIFAAVGSHLAIQVEHDHLELGHLFDGITRPLFAEAGFLEAAVRHEIDAPLRPQLT